MTCDLTLLRPSKLLCRVITRDGAALRRVLEIEGPFTGKVFSQPVKVCLQLFSSVTNGHSPFILILHSSRIFLDLCDFEPLGLSDRRFPATIPSTILLHGSDACPSVCQTRKTWSRFIENKNPSAKTFLRNMYIYIYFFHNDDSHLLNTLRIPRK